MMLPGCKGATTIKLDDAGMMKFRSFPRRTSCRRLSMNRMAHGLKWKPESAARMLRSRPLRAYHGTSSVLSCRARGCHRGDKWVSNMRQKLRARTERCQFLLHRLFLLLEFFSLAFSNLLVDWYSSCWNVSSCCVHVHTCAAEKKKSAERLNMCLSRATHGHAKAKSKRKE